ncbi:MAG: lysylphosphatidylglycerol synthase transmembrane domain-containing protein [Fervidobacterium sp.]
MLKSFKIANEEGTELNLKKIFTNVIISIVVSLAIINLVGIFFAKENPFKTIRSLPIQTLLLLILILLIDYLLHALRLLIVVRSMGHKITFLQAFESMFFNIYFSLVTPMSIGGQPFQIYHLIKLGVTTYDATNIVITRTFVGIMVMFTVNIMFIQKVLSVLRGSLGLTLVVFGFTVTIVISLLGFFGFINKNFVKKVFLLINKVIKSKKVQEKEQATLEWVEKMSESTKILFFKNYWALISDLVIGVIASSLGPLILKISVESFSKNSYPLSLIWGIVMMLNTIVFYIPTPGSSGGIEGVYQLVFSHIYEPRAVLGGIVVLRLLTYYLIVLIGTLLVWKFTRFRDELNISNNINNIENVKNSQN